MDLTQYPVTPPRIVAIATDRNLSPMAAMPDPTLPAPSPRYGQDLTYGTGRASNYDVGKTPAELKPKMVKLLRIFAHADKAGMARRLFATFLTKQGQVYFYDDADLNSAADAHPNIRHFCDAALGDVYGTPPAPGKKRIHQALRDANWDITRLVAPTDLGVPAFNRGSKFWKSGDYGNGLGLMINGVQHAYVIATHFRLDKYNSYFPVYHIHLKYIFYDVFGLDDDDLREYGAEEDDWNALESSVGITAWWQLQHQHNYAPLVTRIVVERTYEVPLV